MKEKLYLNIWNYCETEYPEPAGLLKRSRILLWVFTIYYLLMCFAYMFAMILAYKYDGVDFVSRGNAVNLFTMMTVSVIAEIAGTVCSLQKKYFYGFILSVITLCISPFALWVSTIKTVFRINHLLSMLLLLTVQTVLWIFDRSRKLKIRHSYDRVIEQVLARSRKDGTLLTAKETEQLLNGFVPGDEKPYKPPKRSQKDRIRKNTDRTD